MSDDVYFVLRGERMRELMRVDVIWWNEMAVFWVPLQRRLRRLDCEEVVR